MVYIFFDKKTGGSDTKSMPQNEQLAEEFHKPIIRKFFKKKKRKVYSAFKDNIWDADLADMQLIGKFSKGFRFFLCVIDIFSKCLWVVPLKDKKGLSNVNAFQKILDDAKRKPNKIWVDKDGEYRTLLELFHNSFKKWLQDNDIAMYSTHNEGKSGVAERFIKAIKNKIYKHLTSISKSVYIDKLDDILNEYNNTYHRTIKMKPINVKDNTYIGIGKEVNDNDPPKFKVGDHVRISGHFMKKNCKR